MAAQFAESQRLLEQQIAVLEDQYAELQALYENRPSAAGSRARPDDGVGSRGAGTSRLPSRLLRQIYCHHLSSQFCFSFQHCLEYFPHSFCSGVLCKRHLKDSKPL